MKAQLIALGLLLACAGSTSVAPDAGSDPGADVCDEATQPYCCQGGCNGDVPASALCDAGSWVCEAGSVASTACPTDRFCQGDAPGCDPAQLPTCCESCDGTDSVQPTCDVDAGVHAWECPANSVRASDCPDDSACRQLLDGGS